MKKKILFAAGCLILMVLAFFAGRFVSKSEAVSAEANRVLYALTDYGDEVTYVIGHKSPDTDTVMSAIAMADFLNQLGIKAEARVTGKVNNETAYVLKKLGLEAPEILENAENCQLWLVDHSELTQMADGADKARIVGITDHHGIGSAENEEQIIVRSGRYGSTTAEIYTLYKECGVKISKEMAGVMLAGLLSDTAYLKREDNELNLEIYEGLKRRAGIQDMDGLILGMKEAKLDLSGKTDGEIFYNDYKDYEENGVRYGIGNIKVVTVNDIDSMQKRMQAVAEEQILSAENKNDYIFYYIYDFDYEKGYLGCAGKDAEKVPELLKAAFGDKYEVGDNYVIMKPSVSRKEVLVPGINGALN